MMKSFYHIFFNTIKLLILFSNLKTILRSSAHQDKNTREIYLLLRKQ